jgi:hypothetical protein
MTGRKLAWFTLLLVLAIGVNCSSSSPTPGTASPAASDDGEDISVESQIVQADETFTPETFVAAGWKKSKQYSTETVPGAQEIWYGFYSQRDIEIRFYSSHSDALALGKPLAESAIVENVKRSRGGLLLDVSGGSFSAYNAYIVAGNAILLCELDISSCEGLVENLP